MINRQIYFAGIALLIALVPANDAKAQDTEGFLEADFFADILTFAHISTVNVNVWCEPQINQKLKSGARRTARDRESISSGWVLREELCAGAYQCTMEYDLLNILGPNPLGTGIVGVAIAVQVESAVPFEFAVHAEAHAGQSDAGNSAGLVFAIHSDWQEWFNFPTCLQQDTPSILARDSDTNYILQQDIPLDAPAFVRMTPDAVIDPKSDPTFVITRGLATAQGVLEPGRYTIFLDSTIITNHPDPSQNHGLAKIRLTPIACEADINFDGLVNAEDVNRFIEQATDLDCDQDFDYFDVSAFLNAFISGC